VSREARSADPVCPRECPVTSRHKWRAGTDWAATPRPGVDAGAHRHDCGLARFSRPHVARPVRYKVIQSSYKLITIGSTPPAPARPRRAPSRPDRSAFVNRRNDMTRSRTRRRTRGYSDAILVCMMGRTLRSGRVSGRVCRLPAAQVDVPSKCLMPDTTEQPNESTGGTVAHLPSRIVNMVFSRRADVERTHLTRTSDRIGRRANTCTCSMSMSSVVAMVKSEEDSRQASVGVRISIKTMGCPCPVRRGVLV
jgi:hypothetical protein